MKDFGPALFFFVHGTFLFHSCPLAEGEPYGDFVNYPHSHMDLWEKCYQKKYGVDFDYFPRGRVVYRKTDNTYLIYYDQCIAPQIPALLSRYEGCRCVTALEEHYQCHTCNPDYVV